MSDNWTSGYISEMEYTHGFYKELSPSHLQFAALSKGFLANAQLNGKTTYCELGCGQGFTANIIAASNPEIEVYATDFNPSHIYNAKRLADEANINNVHFFDDSFLDFENRTDLPKFNIISLHGIYSWVAKEHRETIVRFIDKRLKAGGLVYISYNCLPGWAGPSPLQHLIRMHAEKGTGPLTEKVDNALAFLEKLQEEGARYFKAIPKIDERIKDLKNKSKNYLVHEYLNQEWRPFYQSEVSSDLSSARLSYVGTAEILQQIDDINFTASQLKILNEANDGIFRETLRDYIVNRQFRKDIFARGATLLGTHDLREAWLNTGFALTLPGEDIPMKTRATLGEVSLQKDAYWPVINAFEEAGGYAPLREVVKNRAVAQLGWTRLQRVLRILVGSGFLHPRPSGALDDDKRRESTERLNRAIIRQAPHSNELQFLASPVTGSGILSGRLSRVFLLSPQEDKDSGAAFAWSILKAHRPALGKDGEVLEKDEENIAALAEKYDTFLQKGLPVLRRLGIA